MENEWTRFAGVLLKHSRAQAGLSQRKLAALAGVSVSEVARIETYWVQPSIPVLGKLLDSRRWLWVTQGTCSSKYLETSAVRMEFQFMDVARVFVGRREIDVPKVKVVIR